MTFSISHAERNIDEVRWQFAKTMPRWPHEYTVKAWRPDLQGDFLSMVRLIQREGTRVPWPPPPDQPRYRSYYLTIGHLKYWAMGPNHDLDPPEEMTVINRAAD
ncbi:MAG: hypothetical protein ACYDCS_01015 [Candidatus Dormibacteria bacterium]